MTDTLIKSRFSSTFGDVPHLVRDIYDAGIEVRHIDIMSPWGVRLHDELGDTRDLTCWYLILVEDGQPERHELTRLFKGQPTYKAVFTNMSEYADLALGKAWTTYVRDTPTVIYGVSEATTALALGEGLKRFRLMWGWAGWDAVNRIFEAVQR